MQMYAVPSLPLDLQVCCATTHAAVQDAKTAAVVREMERLVAVAVATSRPTSAVRALALASMIPVSRYCNSCFNVLAVKVRLLNLAVPLYLPLFQVLCTE